MKCHFGKDAVETTVMRYMKCHFGKMLGKQQQQQLVAKISDKFIVFPEDRLAARVPVSYTHLTLPTIYSV